MQKISKIVLFVILFVVIKSCTIAKWHTLVKEKDLKITFTDSKKIGKSVNADLNIDDLVFKYNIDLGYKGSQSHIIRYAPGNISNKSDGRLDDFRKMEFLVTDTAKNNPSYLGNAVNAYYDPAFFKGRYEVEKLKKILRPVSAREYKMLKQVKDVLSANQIEFQPIDSSKIIGWFKYDF